MNYSKPFLRGFAPVAFEAAHAEWNALQARTRHPAGSFDNHGRWYPASTEHRDCCGVIRAPSRAYPYSYLVHCRSWDHVVNKHQAEFIAELRLAYEQVRTSTKRHTKAQLALVAMFETPPTPESAPAAAQ
jgi:hypothetical protein